MKPFYQISFSGGRTSGYMTKKLLDNFGHIYNFIITFANTGKEDPRTLPDGRNTPIKLATRRVIDEPS